MRQLQHVGKINSGFSLVEILTVVIISAILITAAIPGYESFVRNNESLVMASRLASSLRLARAEAIKTGIPVTVCPIDSSFNPTTAFDQTTEQWPCQDIITWDAWKVFRDADFNATEDFTNGWPIIEYVGGNNQPGAITSSISGPITFDPNGFANLNPTVTRSGWTWSASPSGGDWSWSNTYGSDYGGSYPDRTFTITPAGCSGNNARSVDVTQNGMITVTQIGC